MLGQIRLAKKMLEGVEIILTSFEQNQDSEILANMLLNITHTLITGRTTTQEPHVTQTCQTQPNTTQVNEEELKKELEELKKKFFTEDENAEG